MNNPANKLAALAQSACKGYWELRATKGKVAPQRHNELHDLKRYEKKCAARRAERAVE